MWRFWLFLCFTSVSSAQDLASLRHFVEANCLDCHDGNDPKGDFDLEAIYLNDIAGHSTAWETVVRRLNARQMPPAGKPRPDEADYRSALDSLVGILDAAAAVNPDPGRTSTFRRLTRTEYRNVIRDLLGLDVDADTLLPRDEISHGFDNITVDELTPSLVDRYLTAAQKISRLAIGVPGRAPGGETFRIRPDLTQEDRVEGLPIGTRGGGLFSYTFPRDGEYEVRVRLARDRNEHVEGLSRDAELEILLNDERLDLFVIKRPRDEGDHQTADAHLVKRFQAKAGPHKLAATFIKEPSSLVETKRQPFEAHFNMHRHPRLTPAVYQVSITGPYGESTVSDTPSRQRVFTHYPDTAAEEDVVAREILMNLARRAYRRPVRDEDLEKPLAFYREAKAEEGFEAGIEMALTAILVSPEFLMRIERDPQGVPEKTAYGVSDSELASRMAFFLWSSIPDEALLRAAERGELSDPEKRALQVARMLADERSFSLVSNFASQWLYLRNLDAITPDLRLFPDFDDNLRQSLREETERFVASVFREDRSLMDLLKADYTFLNERLAKHYNIPHVYGNRFRRVALGNAAKRGGLLRQGSILTVTSYATRTSPVIRGNWILENLLGTPAPPPPPNIPALDDNTVAANLPMRERLAKHRENAACANCHNLMDPVGFSLEHYDAVGRWRLTEEGVPVDASGGLPDGRVFNGVEGLEEGLLARPEVFVGTLTEKLLTFALGRGVELSDAPAVRQIVRDASANDFRFSAVITGIVNSQPFTMRRTP